MRRIWIAIAIVLGALGSAGTASAKLVIMDPPMARQCPKAKSWPLVMACLKKHGKVELLRDLKTGRVVKLTQTPDDVTILIYVPRKREWRLGGLHRMYGRSTILDMKTIKVGKRGGFRLDIGHEQPTTVMVGNISPAMALIRNRIAVFCSGDSYSCTETKTSCEVTVEGRTWFLFHGDVEIGDNVVHVKGDRSRAGPNCATGEKFYLGWTQPHP